MKTAHTFRGLVLGLLACCQFWSGTAATTFSVSPASAPWTTADPVTLNLGGLPTHALVLVEEFSDLNGNGSLDSGEPLVLSFQVQDGEVPLFGGVRDTNRPGDEDGATNGSIRVDLVFGNLPERNRATGNYLFRVSSPNNSFATVTQPFTVAQASYGQSISGKVLDGATPIASAFMGLLVSSGNDSDFLTGAATDAAGNFSLNAAPGDYMLIALKSGYVCNFGNAPQVSVASGLNSTQNVTLLPATRNVSGHLVDALTSNGIPGVQLFIQSQDGQAALGVTDRSGNFSIPVTAGVWQVEPSEKSTALLGYGKKKTLADTTAGDVSGLVLALSRARGDLQLSFTFPSGTFGNGTVAQMAYPTHLQYYSALYNLNDSSAPTNVVFSGPPGSGLSNTVSVSFGGDFTSDYAWYSSPQISLPPYPPGGTYFVNYKNEPQPFAFSDPAAASHQVILQPAVSVNSSSLLEEISWTYHDLNGNTIAAPDFISRIDIQIEGNGGRLYDTELPPGATSHILDRSVIWTNISSIGMAYNDTLDNQYTTYWGRGVQPSYQPVVLQPLPSGNPNQFGLRIFGEAGYTYELQTSSNLSNWSSLFATNGFGAPLDLLDPQATNRTRFYRVLRTP